MYEMSLILSLWLVLVLRNVQDTSQSCSHLCYSHDKQSLIYRSVTNKKNHYINNYIFYFVLQHIFKSFWICGSLPMQALHNVNRDIITNRSWYSYNYCTLCCYTKIMYAILTNQIREFNHAWCLL